MAEFLGMRRVPEDVLAYMLIPSIPEALDESDIVLFLEAECDKYLGFLGPLLIDYIWQNESFTLRPITSKIAETGDAPPHLFGSTNFGDNIEDEWFIVCLLYELSRTFPDLVIRVYDNDGEFVLIEAADYLPGWLTPETADKRIYIHMGKLHIVPMPEKPGDVSMFPLFTPTVEEAVGIVRNPIVNTVASDAIQEALNKRLNSSRAKMDENYHYANVYVPVAVAALLKEKPSLVSAAVQAFYYRDPVELRVCRTMNHFKPENMVVTRVRFTRCLYAQLLQQKFQPDKRSGWMLPNPSNSKFKEYDLGIKLSHGLEILCARNKGSQITSPSDVIMVSDIRWIRFLSSLQEKGYFKNEIEGSELYKKLLDDAKRFFQAQVTDTDQTSSDIAKEIVNMIPKLSTDVEPWKQLEKSLPPSEDDSWLDLTPEALDERMRNITGQEVASDSQDLDLKKVAESMNAFVNKVSSIDGVEFPDLSKSKEKEEEGEGDIEFDGTSFIHAMKEMFEFKDDDDASSSDMSEYDWEDNSDEDLGSPTKMVQERSAVSATKESGNKPPVRLAPRPMEKPSSKPSVHSAPRPVERPSRKAPDRPAKPPALPPKPPPRPSRPPTKRKDPEILAIMDAMDRELAQTEVGKSFEREPPRPKPLKFQPPKAKPRQQQHQNGSAPPAAAATQPKVGSKLVLLHPGRPPARPLRPPPPVPEHSVLVGQDRDIDEEDDEFRPVDVDMNVVKNMLESFQAQQGLPGPAANILQSMRIVLPPPAGEKGEGTK